MKPNIFAIILILCFACGVIHLSSKGRDDDPESIPVHVADELLDKINPEPPKLKFADDGQTGIYRGGADRIYGTTKGGQIIHFVSENRTRLQWNPAYSDGDLIANHPDELGLVFIDNDGKRWKAEWAAEDD